MEFTFYDIFCKLQKDEEKEENNEESKPIFEVAYLGNA